MPDFRVGMKKGDRFVNEKQDSLWIYEHRVKDKTHKVLCCLFCLGGINSGNRIFVDKEIFKTNFRKAKLEDVERIMSREQKKKKIILPERKIEIVDAL